MTSLQGHFARFAQATGGMIAVKFALVIPAVATLALGAVDLHGVHTSKSRIQAIADAAALAGANELGVALDDSAPAERAREWVDAQLSEWAGAPRSTVSTEVLRMPDGVRALKVRIEAHRPSFFGNLLPPGGWHMNGEAIATSVALTPLCVLAHGDVGQRAVRIRDQGKIAAPACMVHSNKEIEVSGGRISAAAVQAVDWARGNISPAPATGAASIEDPFTNLPLRPQRLCTNVQVQIFSTGKHYLAPGHHCGAITVMGDAELVLQPGDHWFMVGPLTVAGNGRLSGEDVALLFDIASNFDFRDQATVNLDGRKSGPFAGFVMAATRLNVRGFTISSDYVETLLGVIYIPSATLIVEGSADVARESAWTVIVSRYLHLRGSPSLFINADYEGSPVPVPDGVGPRPGGSRLIE